MIKSSKVRNEISIFLPSSSCQCGIFVNVNVINTSLHLKKIKRVCKFSKKKFSAIGIFYQYKIMTLKYLEHFIGFMLGMMFINEG